MALWISIAATEESTPPLKPQTTRCLPIVFLKLAVVSLIKDLRFHLPEHLQTLNRKLPRISLPLVVCVTSG